MFRRPPTLRLKFIVVESPTKVPKITGLLQSFGKWGAAAPAAAAASSPSGKKQKTQPPPQAAATPAAGAAEAAAEPVVVVATGGHFLELHTLKWRFDPRPIAEQKRILTASLGSLGQEDALAAAAPSAAEATGGGATPPPPSAKLRKKKQRLAADDSSAAGTGEEGDAAGDAAAFGVLPLPASVDASVNLLRHFDTVWGEIDTSRRSSGGGYSSAARNYGSSRDRLIAAFRSALESGQVTEVVIATDPDREGELIGYHALTTLQGVAGDGSSSASRKKLPPFPLFSRAYIHSITADGVEAAMLQRQRNFYDKGLVEAAITRHNMDRIFGFLGSGVVRQANQQMRSIGRVQSPALIAIREREEAVRLYNEKFVKSYFLNGEVQVDVMSATSPQTFTFALGALSYVALDGNNGATFAEQADAMAFLAKKAAWTVVQQPDGAGTAAAVGAPFLALGGDVTVAKTSATESERVKPAPVPFTMADLLTAANRQFGKTSEQTAKVLQELFQAGLITYPRTDSCRIETAFEEKVEAAIGASYGKDAIRAAKPPAGSDAAADADAAEDDGSSGKKGKKKTAAAAKKKRAAAAVQNVEDAHEAIRPTDMAVERLPAHLSAAEGVYQLIRTRTMAAFMRPKVTKTASVRLILPIGPKGSVTLSGGWTVSKVVDPGFSRAEQAGGAAAAADEGEEDPAATAGGEDAYALTLRLKDLLAASAKAAASGGVATATVRLRRVDVKDKKAAPPTLHTEGSLIDTLKRNGVGRPSTYPNIVKTLVQRGYVQQLGEKNRPVTTPLGQTLVQTAVTAFPNLVDMGFTAKFEKALDVIAKSGDQGRVVSDVALSSFLNFFLGNVTDAAKTMKGNIAARMAGATARLQQQQQQQGAVLLSPTEAAAATAAADAQTAQAVAKAIMSVPCALRATSPAQDFVALQSQLREYLGLHFPPLILERQLPAPVKVGEFPVSTNQLPVPLPAAAATDAKP